MRPLAIDLCKGATNSRQRRGEIGDPCGVPTVTRERMLGAPWKTTVQVLGDKKVEIQSTI